MSEKFREIERGLEEAWVDCRPQLVNSCTGGLTVGVHSLNDQDTEIHPDTKYRCTLNPIEAPGYVPLDFQALYPRYPSESS